MYIKYSKELLEPIVKNSLNYSEVCRKLGKQPQGAMWDLIKEKIAKFDIDVSHFLGKSYHTGFRHTGKAKKQLPLEVLTEGKTRREKSHRLRNALIDLGREYICEECGLGDTWNGKQIALEVDHINWDWSNCKPENVRFLCPNCHSQRKK